MLKRWISLLIILSVLFSMTIIPSAASEPTVQEKAQHLKNLSFFSYDNQDVFLNQKVMRAEAAFYATKLLGVADYIGENPSLYINTTFEDVSTTMWYAPYIGYCTSKGILSGVGNNLFKPEDYVTEKAFLVILLGALGYKSGIDFNWNNIYTTAFACGLVTDVNYLVKTADNTNFTRSDAVTILYSALKAKINGTDTTVIDSLVESNDISLQDAVTAGLIDKSVLNVELESITPLSSQSVLLKFNKNISELDEDKITIYETENTKKELEVSILSVINNEVILGTSSQKKERQYTLEIEDITSVDGYTTEKISKTFSGYVVTKLEADFFRIARAEAVSSREIYVYFTHPVNANAEYPPYYTLAKDGSTIVSGNFINMNVKSFSNGEGVSLQLNNTTLQPGNTYTLNISGDLVSAYGTRLNEGQDESVTFYALSSSTSSSDSDGLNVDDIFALDNRTIEVRFSKEVDSFFAKQFLNYVVYTPKNKTIQVNNVTLIEDGEYKNRALRIGIGENLDKKAKDYELYINFLTDSTKTSSIVQGRYKFSGDHPDSSDLQILDVEAINNRLVSVLLDKPLVADKAVNPEYYTIYTEKGSTYCKPIQVVHLSHDNLLSEVLLLLPANKTLSEDTDYEVEISRYLPFNIDSISKRGDKETFEGTDTAYESAKIADAVIVGENTIRADFSTDITETVPNISISNYTLEYTEGIYTVKKVPLSVTFIDSRTVILRFNDLDYDTPYILKWNNIADLFGAKAADNTSTSGSVNVRMGVK